jgi:endonuclease/exonuclease/phosphatase family metal-dependent hydrolase
MGRAGLGNKVVEQDARCARIQELGCGTSLMITSSYARLLMVQGQTRIVTMATLQHRSTSELLHVGNTHYDDRGRTSRAEASKLIRSLMYNWTEAMAVKSGIDADKAGHAPVVLLGDFSTSCYSPICALHGSNAGGKADMQTHQPKKKAIKPQSPTPRSHHPVGHSSTHTRRSATPPTPMQIQAHAGQKTRIHPLAHPGLGI